MKIVGCGIACVAGSAAVIALAETRTEYVVGCIGLGFFGLCLIGYVALLLLGRPRIDIEPDGIYVSTSLADGICLAWDEISSVERTSLVGQDMIVITPRPEVPWKQRLSLIARLLTRLNQSLSIDGIVLARANLGDQYDLALFALQNSLSRACADR